MQNRARLGQEVYRAREARGYNRQGFAKAAGISLRSLASLETGEKAMGRKVLTRVELALQWPTGQTSRLLESDEPDTGIDLRDEVEREIWRITDLDEDLRWVYIHQRRSRLAQEAPPQERDGT